MTPPPFLSRLLRPSQPQDELSLPQEQGVTASPPLCGPTGGASKLSPAKPAAANAKRIKTLSPDRDKKIARRREKAIRSIGYPARWPHEIATEQGWRCAYCRRHMAKKGDGPRQMTMDHRTPISRGGRTRRANLVAACSECNTRKGGMTEVEFRAVLEAANG